MVNTRISSSGGLLPLRDAHPLRARIREVTRMARFTPRVNRVSLASMEIKAIGMMIAYLCSPVHRLKMPR